MVFPACRTVRRMASLFNLARPSLFFLDPERAHRLTISALKLGLGLRAKKDDPILATRLCGLDLANPIGLAAEAKDRRIVPVERKQ